MFTVNVVPAARTSAVNISPSSRSFVQYWNCQPPASSRPTTSWAVRLLTRRQEAKTASGLLHVKAGKALGVPASPVGGPDRGLHRAAAPSPNQCVGRHQRRRGSNPQPQEGEGGSLPLRMRAAAGGDGEAHARGLPGPAGD